MREIKSREFKAEQKWVYVNFRIRNNCLRIQVNPDYMCGVDVTLYITRTFQVFSFSVCTLCVLYQPVRRDALWSSDKYLTECKTAENPAELYTM